MPSSQGAPLGRRLVAATMTKPTRCSKWAIIDPVEIETPERQMPELLPAISLVAVPGRRRQTLDIAREVEGRGFAGIYIPSRFGNMAQCTALALATEHIPFGTAIAPIYARTAEDFAHSAAYLHEVSGGRFRFGIGIAHGPTYLRLGRSGRGKGPAAPPARALRLAAELPRLLEGSRLYRGDVCRRECDRRQPPRRHPEIPDRPLARRQHPLRPARQGARGRRGMARRRRQHADPRA